MIRFGEDVCCNLDAALRREWMETNGIGGACIAQAWSVTEVLNAAVEDTRGIQPVKTVPASREAATSLADQAARHRVAR